MNSKAAGSVFLTVASFFFACLFRINYKETAALKSSNVRLALALNYLFFLVLGFEEMNNKYHFKNTCTYGKCVKRRLERRVRKGNNNNKYSENVILFSHINLCMKYTEMLTQRVSKLHWTKSHVSNSILIHWNDSARHYRLTVKHKTVKTGTLWKGILCVRHSCAVCYLFDFFLLLLLLLLLLHHHLLLLSFRSSNLYVTVRTPQPSIICMDTCMLFIGL